MKRYWLAVTLACLAVLPGFAQSASPAALPTPAVIQAAAAADPSYLVAPEPLPNIGLLKKQLTAYAECTGTDGCYPADLSAQATRASVLLDGVAARAKKGEKLALVLDIDETALSNLPEIRQDDYGYIGAHFNAWILQAQAPALSGTLALYNHARSLGIKVFFITGRDESQREATVKNLTAAGYGGWSGLALRPKTGYATTAEFKSAERAKLVHARYRLVMSIGDQFSDLAGQPKAEINVKLANPFYYIP